MKLTLLNGPPRCGKDTISDILAELQPGYVLQVKFAQRVKEMTHAALGFGTLPHNYFEHDKDELAHRFRGITPRQAYIQMSEQFAKPLFGPSVFGEWLVEDLKTLKEHRHIVVSDSGFRAEAEVLVDWIGADKVELWHIEREGCSFKADSRGYVDLDDLGIEPRFVTNNGKLKELKACVTDLISSTVV